MLLRVREYEVGALVARATLVVTPLLAFQTFPTRGAFSIAMAVPLLILTGYFFSGPRRRLPIWELAIAALLTLSVLWGDEPSYSAQRLRSVVPVLLATVVAAAVVPAVTALRCLKISAVIMIGSGLSYVLISPAARFADGYSGLAIHGQYAKNAFGGLLVFGLLLVVCSKGAHRWMLAPILVILIILNRSATAWVLAVVLVAATYVLRWVSRGRSGTAVSTFGWLAGSGIGLTVLFLLYSDTVFLNLLGKDPTLSSRTAIWAACVPEIEKAPILGHGAATFLDTDSRSPVTLRIWSHFSDTYLPPHPHNGLLDLWGQLGLVGVLIFLGLIVHVVRSGVEGARRADRTSLTALLCVIFILLFGTTEPTYLGPWLIVTVICAAAVVPEEVRREPRDDRRVPGRHEGRRRSEAIDMLVVPS